MTVPILVTGAFGQVGRRCVANLLARGHTVVASDLRTEAALSVVRTLADQHPPGTLLPAYADLLDPAAIGSLVARHQPRAIVHLADMLSPVSYRNPELARRINVGGTRTLVRAAQGLAAPPLFVYASSAGVYGSRNPYRHPERLSAQTAVDPVDQYGEDKMLAERIIVNSGLSHAILRLGGVISPDGAGALNRDYLLLMRATPGDNRLHTVDARDAALAFANAAERPDSVDGKVLLIGGDDSHLNLHRDVEDDMLQAIGLGVLGGNFQPRDRGHAFPLPGDFRACARVSRAIMGTDQSQCRSRAGHHDACCPPAPLDTDRSLLVDVNLDGTADPVASSR